MAIYYCLLCVSYINMLFRDYPKLYVCVNPIRRIAIFESTIKPLMLIISLSLDFDLMITITKCKPNLNVTKMYPYLMHSLDISSANNGSPEETIIKDKRVVYRVDHYI